MTADIQPRGAGLGRGHLPSIALIAVFGIAGPLVAYSLLRSAGLSAVAGSNRSAGRQAAIPAQAASPAQAGSMAQAASPAPAWTTAQAASPAHAATTVQAVRTRTAVPRPDGRGPVCQRPAGVLL
jgi:hypothetical protein